MRPGKGYSWMPAALIGILVLIPLLMWWAG